MTRDDLIAWLLLPWNIVKAIVLTAYWIIAALIRGGDDDEDAVAPALPAVDPAVSRRDRAPEPKVTSPAGAEHRGRS